MLGLCQALIDNENDKIAFEKLYKLNKHKTYVVAYKITHNVQMAEDAVADAFLSVARNFDKICNREIYDQEAYLVRAVKNSAITAATTESRKPTVSYENLAFDEEPSFEMFRDANYKELVNAIKSLDEKYKSILALKVHYEFSMDEIAKSLKISRRTAFNYYNEAKKIISEELKLDYDK